MALPDLKMTIIAIAKMVATNQPPRHVPIWSFKGKLLCASRIHPSGYLPHECTMVSRIVLTEAMRCNERFYFLCSSRGVIGASTQREATLRHRIRRMNCRDEESMVEKMLFPDNWLLLFLEAL